MDEFLSVNIKASVMGAKLEGGPQTQVLVIIHSVPMYKFNKLDV
jgi:hypothetical protein